MSFEAVEYFNCPQCGDRLNIYFKYSKLTQCASCKSTIFLEDKNSLKIGEESTLAYEPSLFGIHNQIKIENKIYIALGKVRYAYGRGFWDEWFLNDTEGRSFFLSVDEGDYALEEKKPVTLPLKNILEAKIGTRYGDYVAQERGYGEIVGFEGELPKNITIGQKLFYVHFSFGYGRIVTAEYIDNKTITYDGKWIDPFDIEVLYE